MIFVSTSCIKARRIDEAVRLLAEAGYQNIELSGGTQHYSGWKEDLLRLKSLYDLTYCCHNYFPPPETHFVLNMASSNRETRERSVDFFLEALRHAADLGSERYSYHAGFYVEIGADEIGKPLKNRNLSIMQEAEAFFFEGHDRLAQAAQGLEIKLFVENNVLGSANFGALGAAPFMLLTWEDAERLRAKYSFDLLVDLAHLKVTCHSLELDFLLQAQRFLAVAEYVHVSDNDGKEDCNDGILVSSDILSVLAATRVSPRQITLEVYRDLATIRNSYEMINGLDRFSVNGASIQ